MPPTLSPQEFLTKWKKIALKESAAAQEHFIDLCRLLDHPTLAAANPTGQTFAFEVGATKASGGQGWADVGKKGCFAWEYKGKHTDLDAAYQQLLQYRESLLNPEEADEKTLPKCTLTSLYNHARPSWTWRTRSWMLPSSTLTAGRTTSATKRFWSACWH